MHEPPSTWVRSIDAVYAFVEDESVRSKYPTLSTRVTEAVRACERAFDEYGCV